jgi:RimJ/RimL family protein N-acetyltransferase
MVLSQPTIALEHIETRPLLPTDSDDLRALRLEALNEEGQFFASSYAVEEKLSADDWARMATEDSDHCVIGLFRDTELIGMSVISKWSGDETGRTALFGSSFIKEDYRGKGLGNPLYAARMEWTKSNSQYTSAVLFIRDGNSASTALHKKFGGEYTHPKMMKWGDGLKAIGHWYKITFLSKSRPTGNSRPQPRPDTQHSGIAVLRK